MRWIEFKITLTTSFWEHLVRGILSLQAFKSSEVNDCSHNSSTSRVLRTHGNRTRSTAKNEKAIKQAEMVTYFQAVMV